MEHHAVSSVDGGVAAQLRSQIPQQESLISGLDHYFDRSY
jgi:hypothetical protein